MPELKNTEIFRGGVTAPYLKLETRRCMCVMGGAEGPLTFYFSIASKGGGTTKVRLAIGKADLPAILEEVALSVPETVTMLLEAAALASKKTLRQLDESRSVIVEQKTRAQTSIEKLRSVAQYIEMRINVTPVGEDKKEVLARDTLNDAIALLRNAPR